MAEGSDEPAERGARHTHDRVRVTVHSVNQCAAPGIQGECPSHLEWLPCCHIRIDVVVINRVCKMNARVTDFSRNRADFSATVVYDPEA